MRLLKQGKVKDIYERDIDTLVFHFSDRVSAFDVIMKEEIPFKGKILCDFAVFWFSSLRIKNHFIERIDANKILVKKLNIIPVECVVRKYLYGSLYFRYCNNSLNLPEFDSFFKNKDLQIATKLPFLLFDPTTKSEEHDVPITENQIIDQKILNRDEFNEIKNSSLGLFEEINKFMEMSGFILADIKFEFGKDPKTGQILLADSIGPDECRLWEGTSFTPGKIQESYDKQILRDWLEEIGFKKTVDTCSRLGIKPDPPKIPDNLIKKISERYIEAYERITKQGFKKNS